MPTNQFAKEKQLKTDASSSFDVTRNSFTFQLKTLIEQISPITAIINATSAAIISEIGDISKLDSPRKLGNLKQSTIC